MKTILALGLLLLALIGCQRTTSPADVVMTHRVIPPSSGDGPYTYSWSFQPPSASDGQLFDFTFYLDQPGKDPKSLGAMHQLKGVAGQDNPCTIEIQMSGAPASSSDLIAIILRQGGTTMTYRCPQMLSGSVVTPPGHLRAGTGGRFILLSTQPTADSTGSSIYLTITPQTEKTIAVNTTLPPRLVFDKYPAPPLDS